MWMMEDELEVKVIHQALISHMKLVSKFVGSPPNISQLWHGWRLCRANLLRPEFLLITLITFIIFFYLHAVTLWSRNLVGRLNFDVNRGSSSGSQKLKYLNHIGLNDVEKFKWEIVNGNVAAYAIQGRRPKMEDRFVVNKNINDTGVSFFAVFDGHGGEFAANYAQENLMVTLISKIAALQRLIANGVPSHGSYIAPSNVPLSSPENKAKDVTVEREKNLKKTAPASVTDDCLEQSMKMEITDPQILEKLCHKITRKVLGLSATDVSSPPAADLQTYLIKEKSIDYRQLLHDVVLSTDKELVAAAKKTMNIAGTTALIALIEGSRLIVANVGDSRGVMCDHKGNAIPLSFDHKPQMRREKQRIREAGGFIAFNGVWRVAGVLATSRALGDYPLKDKNLVIASPDVLTFDLYDHKPQFLVLASDGLWDTFTNEEVVAFIKERLREQHFGAKSLTHSAYLRGSLDNITVMVINLKDHDWSRNSMT
nr:PREDICTED: protein phosphatase 1L [Bemisia tabaci]